MGMHEISLTGLSGRHEAEGEEKLVFLRWKNKHGICSGEMIWECFTPNGRQNKKQKKRSSKPCQIQLGLVWSSYVSAEAAIYSFLFFFFNWRIFALQCCIGFWYTTTQTNCKYIYLFIPSSWDPHPSHFFRLSQSNQLNWSRWTYSLLYRVK